MTVSSAARMAGIEPFHVMELMAKAQALEAQGRDIVHMEVGEPDFPTPRPIIEAAQRFLAGGHVHYTSALGIAPLREAIAGFYATRYGVTIDPARIVITAGASGALLLALGALITPGDEWLLTDPGYPCNRHFVRFCEGVPRALDVDATTNFQPTAAQVGAGWTARTQGLLVASPANPTGTLIEPEQLAALWEAVQAHGGTLIVDEIYHGLTYGFDARTALALSDDIIVINSFSKYFGMTGWRLGWLVVPPHMVRDIEKLAQNLYIAPSTLAQQAVLAAFTPETLAICETQRMEFKARRDLLLPGLRQIGFDITVEPKGAFYIYAGIGELDTDSNRLAGRLLNEAGVAATPGLDFGANAPGRHMRFAYTTSTEQLALGIERMSALLRRQ
jgi:aspartate/methionine/tyrosine aminotransferase